MKKILSILFTIFLVIPVISQTSDKRFKGIDKELNKALEVFKAPGFAVAVVEKDKIIYAQGFGYSDFEKKIPVDPNTLFAIGSCS